MLATLLFVSTALSGWGPAGCGPVGPIAVASPTHRLPQWEGWYPTPKGNYGEYAAGRQIGLWEPRSREYTSYDEEHDAWGETVVLKQDPRDLSPTEVRRLVREASEQARRAKSKPTCPCAGADCCAGQCQPCRCVGAQAVEANYGVDLDRIAHGRERYAVNGVPVTLPEARQALAGGQVPDDQTKLRLTIIGDDAQRRAVLDDLAKAPELVSQRDRFVVQDYPRDHWAVARAGFATSGTPTIYVQAPDGKVLHRQDDYRGPADLAGALRRADPNYDSSKDPDLRKLPLPLPLDLTHVPVAAWILAAGGLALFFLRKDKP